MCSNRTQPLTDGSPTSLASADVSGDQPNFDDLGAVACAETLDPFLDGAAPARGVGIDVVTIPVGPIGEMGSDLVGRERECAAIEALVASARAGKGAALVIIGEAGIGKSRLLDYAAAHADDFTVLRVSGVESETGLSYAGLHRLLGHRLRDLPSLPAPQRDALEVVFGLARGQPTNRFLVGLAALTLLTDASSGQPVLCVIDDVQWLDHESVEVLAFVARRVLADRVALLIARRADVPAPGAVGELPLLAVQGLSQSAALELLGSVAHPGLDHATAARIVGETAGNPLAIIELTAELSAKRVPGGSDPLQPLPLTARLEARFIKAARDLPADTQQFMLLAAAEPTDSPQLLHGAAVALGIRWDAADAAEAAGLLATTPHATFRHPLIRSAVYGAATADERRRVHAALASVDIGDAGADMRAWHLSLGTIGLNEAIAAELEASATRIRRRSGYTTEASFLVRAADLTPDTKRATARLLTAAVAAAAAGAQARARAILDRARSQITDEEQHAFSQWLHGLFLMHEGRYGEAPAVLLAAARVFQRRDPSRARVVMLDALGAVCLAGDRAADTTPVEVARTALSMPRQAEVATLADLLLEGVATRIAAGFEESVPILRAALESWSPEQVPAENVTNWCVLGTYAALELLDDRALHAWVEAIERYSREQGSIVLLRVVLYGLATAAGLSGRLADAEAFNTEARQLNTVTGAPAHLDALIDVELLGLQGREEGRAAALFVQQIAAATGFDRADCRGVMACMRLDLASGRYSTALEAGLSLADRIDLGAGSLVLPDLVEAGARGGDIAAAQAALERLGARARTSKTSWSLGLLARARALLANDNEAEAHYQDAIRHLAKTTAAVDSARAHLLYGEWLRRQNRRMDARHELWTARNAFVSMRVNGFAERARIELLATGEHARRRTVDTTNELTAQERQIAELAAQRETNREIATRLFISASTVDYHLRSVYQKLGINSRRQLEQALHAAS